MRIVGTKLLPTSRLACWRQNLELLNVMVRIVTNVGDKWNYNDDERILETWVPEAITVISDLTKVNLSWKITFIKYLEKFPYI